MPKQIAAESCSFRRSCTAELEHGIAILSCPGVYAVKVIIDMHGDIVPAGQLYNFTLMPYVGGFFVVTQPEK